MTEEIVICENLSKRFIVGNSVVNAVNGVDLTFHKKEFTSRLISVIENSSLCPIVYNVYEFAKRELWV